MARTFGEIPFTLLQVYVAAYDIVDDTYGTAQALPEPMMVEISPEADTDEIKAQGYVQHLLTVTTKCGFKFGHAGFPFDAWAVIVGTSNASSGTPPNATRRSNVDAGGAGLPYFGVVGRAAAEDGADVWVGLAVCKLNSVPSWKVEQNKFVIGEAEGVAIKRQDYGKVVYLVGHQTATAITAGNFSDAFAWNV